VHVTISIGAVRPSFDCQTPEQLLASADAALYVAKRGGRNQSRIGRGAPMLVPVDASEGLEGVVQALAAAASIRARVKPAQAGETAGWRSAWRRFVSSIHALSAAPVARCCIIEDRAADCRLASHRI